MDDEVAGSEGNGSDTWNGCSFTRNAGPIERIGEALDPAADQFEPELVPVDYDDEARNLLARAKRLESLRKRRPQAAYQLDRWLDKHSRKDMDVAWIPVVARESSLTMLLDSRTGAVLGALPIDPW